MGQIFPIHVKCLTTICLFVCNLCGSTIIINRVICKNIALPVLKTTHHFVYSPNDIICELEVKNNYIFGILDPILSIHYTTYTRVVITIKDGSHVRFLPLDGFRLWF